MPLTLFPYQIEGAKFLASRTRAGLFDEMGVGKTATAIGALDQLGTRRALIVCPAMLRENWRAEFAKFGRVSRRVVKGTSVHDLIAWQRGRFDVLVTSYEMATRWLSRIAAHCELIDAVVLDEAHYLKNTGSARSKALLGERSDGIGGILQWARRAWLLTGTPMANDPVDIYPFLRITGATSAPLHAWTRKYMYSRPSAYGSRQSPRPEHTEELRHAIAGVSLRRSKRDVGMQLPPVFLTSVVVDGDTEEIGNLLRQHPGLEGAVLHAIEQGGLSFLDAQHIATLRRLVGAAKAIPYARMLVDELHGTDEKRVVFGLHKRALRDVRDILVAEGIKAVIVNGDVPEAERQEAVRAFQNDPDCRVFIGNTRAAGVGLTLTAACELDMLESEWSPAGNAQAIMRVHRIGQSRHVRARFITLAASIDEAVNRVVASKVASIASIEGSAMVAALDTPALARAV